MYLFHASAGGRSSVLCKYNWQSSSGNDGEMLCDVKLLRNEEVKHGDIMCNIHLYPVGRGPCFEEGIEGSTHKHVADA